MCLKVTPREETSEEWNEKFSQSKIPAANPCIGNMRGEFLWGNSHGKMSLHKILHKNISQKYIRSTKTVILSFVTNSTQGIITTSCGKWKDCLHVYAMYILPMCLFTVYNAVGLASFDLFDEIDYDSWFKNHLLKELQIKDQR